MQELLDLFQRNQSSLKAGVVSYQLFARTVDVYCIFNNIDHCWPFRSF